MKITARHDGTILDVLLEALGTASRTRIRKMLQYGMILVAGRPVTRAEVPVAAGQLIEYRKKPGRPKDDTPPVPIVFEDEHLLVVEKPAGLLTYGKKGTGGTSLYRILKEYLKERPNGRQALYVVHRLDREVSGLILFAKTAKIQEDIKQGWRETRKGYQALVEGRPEKDRATLRSWLKEGTDRKVHSADTPENAKLAVTHYRVLKELPGRTLLEVKTETGRKNQIRVHLSEMGHPLVGDRRYGADGTVARRIRLHAGYLGFNNPVSGDFLEFESPMPKGFLSLDSKDEKHRKPAGNPSPVEEDEAMVKRHRAR